MRLLPVACAIVISRIASADGTGVIAIGEGRGAALAAAITAIHEGGPARVIDALPEARAAFAAGAVPVDTLARFRRVRELVAEGWSAYLHVQVGFAAGRLAAARTEAEPLVALPGGAALYADASLRLGAVLGNLGRTDEAKAALALALALDPDRPIELAEFSPDVRAAADAVRTATPQTREVAISVAPPGAVVAVDGKEIGLAPLHASLALGQHVVVARAPLYETRAQAVAVDQATADVEIELTRDETAVGLSSGAAAGMRDEAAQAVADAAMLYADLDQLVLIATTERSGGPTLLVQRCAGVPARCTAIVELGYADRAGVAAAARAAWQEVRAGDLRYPPTVFGDRRLTGHHVEDRCALCRNPWVIGGVSAAVAIATVAVIAIATASRPPPTVNVNPGDWGKP